jgi:hypothetical protein
MSAIREILVKWRYISDRACGVINACGGRFKL